MVLQLYFWACTPFVVIKLGYPLVPAPPRGRSGPVAPQRRERRCRTPPWTTMGAASVSCAARRRSRRHGTRRSTEALGPCSLGLCWDLRSGAWRGGARRVQWPWAAPPLSQGLPGARYPCSPPPGQRTVRGYREGSRSSRPPRAVSARVVAAVRDPHAGFGAAMVGHQETALQTAPGTRDGRRLASSTAEKMGTIRS
jgi:hypothetical protein